MNQHAVTKTLWLSSGLWMAVVLGLWPASAVRAQGGFVGLAPPDAMDNVSGMSTGGGNFALERAQGLQGQPGMMPGMMPGMPYPGAYGPQPGFEVPQAVEPVIPRITVLTGERVRDAVTKELLDDPVERRVPETDSGNYFDDGTHGDVVPGDGKYAFVEYTEDVLGESSQRAKEQMVKALVVAEDMTPLEFYGFSIMTTERRNPRPRDRAWQMIPDPKGGPGMVLAEVPTERPVQVPNYREWRTARDVKFKEDWAVRFLRNYRENPDSITSEFYPLYIPQPPQPPDVRPPVAEGWMPFSDPEALLRAQTGEMGAPGGGGMAPGGFPGAFPGAAGGVTGAPVGNASSRYF